MAASAPAIGRPPELAALRRQAAHCRECPLGALATQTVWGEGAARSLLGRPVNVLVERGHGPSGSTGSACS